MMARHEKTSVSTREQSGMENLNEAGVEKIYQTAAVAERVSAPKLWFRVLLGI